MFVGGKMAKRTVPKASLKSGMILDKTRPGSIVSLWDPPSAPDMIPAAAPMVAIRISVVSISSIVDDIFRGLKMT